MEFKRREVFEVVRSLGADTGRFDILKWVLKARSTDDSRRALNGILVENGLFVACDGFRIHAADIPNPINPIPDGCYGVLVNSHKQIVLADAGMEKSEFPDIWGLFGGDIRRSGKGALVTLRTDRKAGASQAMGEIIRKTGKSFNVKYLEDALSLPWYSQVILEEERKPAEDWHMGFVIIGTAERWAVLMPMTR